MAITRTKNSREIVRGERYCCIKWSINNHQQFEAQYQKRHLSTGMSIHKFNSICQRVFINFFLCIKYTQCDTPLGMHRIDVKLIDFYTATSVENSISISKEVASFHFHFYLSNFGACWVVMIGNVNACSLSSGGPWARLLSQINEKKSHWNCGIIATLYLIWKLRKLFDFIRSHNLFENHYDR